MSKGQALVSVSADGKDALNITETRVGVTLFINRLLIIGMGRKSKSAA